MKRGKATAAYHDKLIRKVLSDRKAVEEFLDSIERDLKGYRPDFYFLEKFIDTKMDRNAEVTEDGKIILPLPEPALFDEVLQYIVEEVADEKYITEEQAEDWVTDEYSEMQYETDTEKRIESLLSQKSPGFSFKVLPREKVELILSVPKFMLDRKAAAKFIKSLGQDSQFLQDISDAIGEAAEFKVMDAIKQWLDPDRANYDPEEYDRPLLVIPPKTEQVLSDAWQFLNDVSTEWTDPDKWARWIMTTKMKLSAASVMDVLDDAASSLDSRGQQDLAAEIDSVAQAIREINKSKTPIKARDKILAVLDAVAEEMESRDPDLAAKIDEVTQGLGDETSAVTIPKKPTDPSKLSDWKEKIHELWNDYGRMVGEKIKSYVDDLKGQMYELQEQAEDADKAWRAHDHDFFVDVGVLDRKLIKDYDELSETIEKEGIS